MTNPLPGPGRTEKNVLFGLGITFWMIVIFCCGVPCILTGLVFAAAFNDGR